MTTKRKAPVEVARGDDEPSTTRVLTPELTWDQAVVLHAYCRKYGASRGPAILARAIESMRADITAEQAA